MVVEAISDMHANWNLSLDDLVVGGLTALWLVNLGHCIHLIYYDFYYLYRDIVYHDKLRTIYHDNKFS